jgi:hypothetical protein
MNRAVTIAYRTGGTPCVLTGPEVPVHKQTTAFKTLVAQGVPDCESIELWTSSAGLIKRKKFPPAAKTADASAAKTRKGRAAATN